MNIYIIYMRLTELFLEVFATKEELNLHFGIHLWGKQTGRKSVQQLGATMHLGGDGVRHLGSLFSICCQRPVEVGYGNCNNTRVLFDDRGQLGSLFLGSL